MNRKPYIGGVIGHDGHASGVFSPGGLSNPGDAPTLDLNFDGQASSGTGDNHWDSVTLFLDGSSTTNDLSPADQDASITNNGSTASVTGPTGYGTVSALSFNGTTQYLKTSYYTASLYNQDFTIEGWFNIASSSTGAAQTFFSHRTNTSQITGVTPFITSSGSRYGLVVGDGAVFQVNVYQASGSGTVTAGWHHIAVTRNGNDYTLFVDGVTTLTGYTSATVAVSGDFTVASGTSGTVAQYLDCEVFDFRVTEGVARYTADFTPPSTKLPTATDATAQNKLATDIISCTRSTTATYVDSNGVLATAAANVPRVEFDGNGNPLGLLVEEDRINYLTDTTQGKYGNAPVSETFTTGPDDVSSSAVIPLPNSNSDRFEWIIAANTFANNDILTVSWHVKPLAGNTPSIYPGEIRLNAFIGMSPGTAYKVSDLGNGWERWAAPITVTDTTIDQKVRLYFGYPLDNGANAIPRWDNDLAYYGFQLEEGEGATSYIPNTASTGTASRDDDHITLATSSFGFNGSAMTSVCEATVPHKVNGSGTPRIFELSDGTQEVRPQLLYPSQSSSNLSAQWRDGHYTTAVSSTVVSGFTYPLSVTAAVRTDGTTGSYAVDGLVGSGATITAPKSAATQLTLGSTGTAAHIVAHIRRFTYFPRALSDASLAAYTSDKRPTDGQYLPTRKWGGITGQSTATFGSGYLKTTGIATLAEHYQSKLQVPLLFAHIIAPSANTTLSNATYTATTPATALPCTVRSSSVLTGKSYVEVIFNTASFDVGLTKSTSAEQFVGETANSLGWFISANSALVAWSSGSSPSFNPSSDPANYAINDVIGMAIDATAQTLQFYKNGATYGGTINYNTFASGASVYLAAGNYQSQVYNFNFGQDHTFAGEKSPLTTPFTDDDGNGEFRYQPPNGFKALTTSY